jgi:hypothetical protein
MNKDQYTACRGICTSPANYSFMLRHKKTGEWLGVSGWKTEWRNKPAPCCPVFSADNLGVSRRDDLHLEVFVRGIECCWPVRVYQKDDGDWIHEENQGWHVATLLSQLDIVREQAPKEWWEQTKERK